MKTHVLIAIFYCSFALLSPVQSVEKVTIRLKNNGALPREFKFVTYQPGDKYRDVFTTYLLPGATHKIEYKIGTSIAQVNQAEINQIMKGLDVPGKPLIVLKAENNGQTIKLIRQILGSGPIGGPNPKRTRGENTVNISSQYPIHKTR